MMSKSDKYLTIRQTSKKFQIPEHRVRVWVKNGKLAGFQAGNRFYIDSEALQRILPEMATRA